MSRFGASVKLGVCFGIFVGVFLLFVFLVWFWFVFFSFFLGGGF